MNVSELVTTVEPTAAPAAKPFWQSKTFWFNTVTLLMLIAEALTAQQLLPPAGLQVLTTINVVGNVVLRFFTAEPVSARPVSTTTTPTTSMTVQQEYLYHKRRMAEMEAAADTGGERPN